MMCWLLWIKLRPVLLSVVASLTLVCATGVLVNMLKKTRSQCNRKEANFQTVHVVDVQNAANASNDQTVSLKPQGKPF